MIVPFPLAWRQSPMALETAPRPQLYGGFGCCGFFDCCFPHVFINLRPKSYCVWPCRPDPRQWQRHVLVPPPRAPSPNPHLPATGSPESWEPVRDSAPDGYLSLKFLRCFQHSALSPIEFGPYEIPSLDKGVPPGHAKSVLPSLFGPSASPSRKGRDWTRGCQGPLGASRKLLQLLSWAPAAFHDPHPMV